MNSTEEAQSADLQADPSRQQFADSFRRGVMGTWQISLFPFIFGVLFMTAAISRGFSAAESMLMSAAVFAGSVLFAGMELWSDPLPYFALAVTAASVGSRHVLMGLTLPPLFRHDVKRTPLWSLFFLTDLNWLLTTKTSDVSSRFAFFLGSTLVIYSCWIAGSLVGLAALSAIDETTLQATRSVGPIFLCLIIIMYARGFRGSRAPWVAAAIAATATAFWNPKLSVLGGVAVGAVVAWLITGTDDAK